ncbi:MAG: cyclic nucleotide-binding domain-containing protein [Chloroflexi bacterium]|nr:cyclic nucleotide-binding domain-containing protein [Chloroflexota bacterium]
MITKFDFLAQHPLFEGLEDDELEELATLAEEFEYQDGTVVAYQRDVADCLFIVKSGRLYAQAVERGVVTSSDDFLPGDYLGLDWLFTPSIHPATVQATSRDDRPIRLIIFKGRRFLHYLSNNHAAIDSLSPIYDDTDTLIAGFPEEVHKQALKIKAKRDRRSNTMNILPDELIEFISRRSSWYLFVRLLLPLIGLLILPLIPFAFLSNLAPDTFLYNFRAACPGLLALFFLFWTIFRFFDWRNDYFIVTNRRVIHREFSLRTFRVDIKVARIDQIQSVSVDKPSLIANLFNFGTARITTASQFGIILFDNIDKPQRVTDTLGQLTQQVRTLDFSREQTLVRRSIEDYFQFDQPYQLIPDEDEIETEPEREDKPGFWQRFYGRYQWRVEEGNSITYRKHFLVAIVALVWPLIISGIIALLSFLIVRLDLLSSRILFPIMGILYFFVLFWIVWRIEDWRNDVYMLTDRLIIDIDRMPFGFGESSKRAALANIQNVKAFTPGLIHTIFNYGYVEVETAGVDSNIEFEDVPFPAVVQSDIFYQIEEFKRRQREMEEARRHKSFAVLLDVYKQEEEQGRLPRRTPYPINEED